MANNPDITSPYYPYYKVQDAYIDLSDTVDLPRKICDYLIDAPNGLYKPKDDNKNPRCRLWKYLYHDTAKPLEKKLPTIKEKMSVVFNPSKPEEPPTDKGYRLIPQYYTKQSQTTAQTRIYTYLGRTVPTDNFRMSIAVKFLIFTHYTYEANTKTDEYSRCLGIEQAIIEALHGVNMSGVGTFSMSKRIHPECGSVVMSDGKENVGRELTLALEFATTKENDMNDFDNMLDIGNGLKLV
jgi:hypothetical protein